MLKVDECLEKAGWGVAGGVNHTCSLQQIRSRGEGPQPDFPVWGER